jgi:Predicted kinase
MILQDAGHTRVCRDDIRFSLYGKYWGVDESVVTQVENAMIEAALSAGQDTVVDATNLSRNYLRTKLSLASKYGAQVVFKDFPISLQGAIERDKNRERTVGEDVVHHFFKQYKINTETGVLPPAPEPLPNFEQYTTDYSKPRAYIVDTDGTVANHEGVRSPYDTSKYALDNLHRHVAGIVYALNKADVAVIGLSGRDEKFRTVTQDWWLDNGMEFDDFFMRPVGDTRMDAIVKYELFKEYVEPKYSVLGAFDDRPQVIRMWETIGVPVFNVGTGEEF